MQIEVPLPVLIDQQRREQEREETGDRQPLYIEEPLPYWPDPKPPADEHESNRGVVVIE